MEFPADLKYTKNDEWIRADGTVGITDYAQDQLSDVVFVEIVVSEGDEVAQGDIIATIESVKAAADVYAPVGGKVAAVNAELDDSPELVNEDPYGKAWLIKLEIADAAELDGLMDASAYEAYCKERE